MTLLSAPTYPIKVQNFEDLAPFVGNSVYCQIDPSKEGSFYAHIYPAPEIFPTGNASPATELGYRVTILYPKNHPNITLTKTSLRTHPIFLRFLTRHEWGDFLYATQFTPEIEKNTCETTQKRERAPEINCQPLKEDAEQCLTAVKEPLTPEEENPWEKFSGYTSTNIPSKRAKASGTCHQPERVFDK